MPNFVENVLRLDHHNDLPGLIKFVQQEQHDPNEMLSVIFTLLGKTRLGSAFVVAMMLANRHTYNPIISLTLSLGGLCYFNPKEEERGLKLLATQWQTSTPQQQTTIHQHILQPLIPFMLEILQKDRDNTRLLKLLETLKIIIPSFQTLFNWPAEVTPLTQEALTHQGQESGQPTLPPSSTPPSTSPSTSPEPDSTLPPTAKQVVLVMRPNLTLHDLPPINHFDQSITSAIRTYGWQITLCPIQPDNLMESCQAIVTSCQQQRADILLLDDLALLQTTPLRSAMIQQLRHNNPEIKIVGCYWDAEPWDRAHLSVAAQDMDLLWTTDSAVQALKRQPVLANKILDTPFPTALHSAPSSKPIETLKLFSAGSRPHDWPLTLLQVVLEHLNLANRKEKRASELDPATVKSHAAYLQLLTDATCCINISRDDQHRQITSYRAFEIIRSGALLIQETTATMGRYFIPGQHYLTFSNLSELAAILQFIQNEPQAATEIRQRGHAFAQEHYHNRTLIGYLDHALFFHADQIAPEAQISSTQKSSTDVAADNHIEVKLWALNPEGTTPLFAAASQHKAEPTQNSEPQNHDTATDIMLSICIPTYNREKQLAHVLDHLTWTIDANIEVEIIVSDNVSIDNTEQVALEKGEMFPHFRYIRLTHHVDGDINAATVLRMARGKFFIWMGDDDLLIPQALLDELEYLNQHDEIIVSHSTSQMWSTVTNTDLDCVYTIEEPIHFTKQQSFHLLNYILEHQVFPEWGIYRTANYLRVLMIPNPQRAYFPLIRAFRALEYGTLRLHPTPFYRVVIQAALKQQDLNQKNEGVRQVTTYADQYRGGIEIALSITLGHLDAKMLNSKYRPIMMELLNNFVTRRISVAARISLRQKNYLAASEFLKRQLIWARDEAEYEHILKDEEQVVNGAVYQMLGELYHNSLEAKKLILCAMDDAEEAQNNCREIIPGIATLIRDLPTAIKASDRLEALYFTDHDATRQALEKVGVDVGKIVVKEEMQRLFRVHG